MSAGDRRRVAIAAALAIALAWLGAGCGGPAPPREGTVVARVAATPDSVLIGEPVRVRFEVRAPLGQTVHFAPRPADDSLWTWQSWSLGRPANSTAGVHHELLATALAFRTGRLALPRTPYRVTRQSFSGAMASTMASPARTARWAASSCACG